MTPSEIAKAVELARELRSLLDGFEPEFRLIANMKQSEMVVAVDGLLVLAERCGALEHENEALGNVYGVAAYLRTFPVPFDDHYRLVGEVDECRAKLAALDAGKGES
jgi:hypothetical protein